MLVRPFLKMLKLSLTIFLNRGDFILAYIDILNSVTRILNKSFPKIEIYTEQLKQGFDDTCFFVRLIPMSNSKSTLTTVSKSLGIDIQYISNDGIENIYSIQNSLERVFNTNIKVMDRYMTIDDIEINIINDGIGDILHFIISIEYDDEIEIEEESYELMGEVSLKIEQEV